MSKFLLSVAFCFSTFLSFSQGEANWWYFGANAGLHFNPNPTPVTGGQINTVEGVASISDAAGNLLFYTDGLTVYTKLHTVMANGTGLMGDPSSTQSAIIVQKPGSSTLYYIFTAALATSPNGFRYSVVDITLNAGLGGVTAQKNVAIYQPTTERICAIRHCNNTDIWIVSHFWGTNEFRAYLLTSAGLNMTVVSSNTGTSNSVNTGLSIGYLKASPLGNKLSMVMHFSTGSTSIAELYDFDNTTGVVSNAVNLGSGYTYAYGTEFSPDGSLLYVNSTTSSRIYQYNLLAGSNAQIVASQLQIGTSTSTWMGAMQLGPDRKIYLSRYQSNYLGVINSPNTLGIGCNYVDNGVSLGSMQNLLGLPNFYPSYINSCTPTVSSTLNCLNGTFGYTIPTSCTGGSGVQSLQWNFGDVASGANNISASASPLHAFSSSGNYTVKLILNFLCFSDTGTINITVNSCGMTVTGNGDSICAGGCGNISAVASGGATPYTYVWTPNIGNGAGPFAVCPASTTSYKVVATDLNGLSDSTIIQVVVNSVPLVNPTSTNITCFGNSNGMALANAIGNSPFTYTWNSLPIQTTGTANNLSQGNYSVTATDVNGCSASGSVIISEPGLLTATINSVADVNCNGGNDGSATVSATGGTVAYNYLWSNGQTSITATNLVAGNYNVTVTDANNCTASATAIISEPALLTASINSFTDVSCGGGNNGSATVLATGGTVAYNYLWNDGQAAATATNLVAGNYIVTVSDAHNCSATASATISAPTTLTVSINSIGISCNGGNDGSADAVATGGAAAYNYLWNIGQTFPSITNLIAGNYIITVTDANNCSASASVTISEPTLLAVSINSFADVSCNGANDGSADALATGGTTAYNYLWNSGQTSSSIANLSAGNYDVTVTDANACSASASVIISEPSALLVSMNAPVNVNCNGDNTGSASVNVSGGTPAYLYSWSDGQTTASAISLVAATYLVTVTDANTCSASTSVTITEPPLLVLTTSAVDGICSQPNGSATVVASGGVSAYAYNWNSVPVQTSATASNLFPGNYSVTVTDANSCSVSASQLVQTTIVNITVTISSTLNVNCNGGQDGEIISTTSSGTAPYYFSLDSIGFTNSGTFQNLVAGNYVVYVHDANNCTGSQTVPITEPTILTVVTGTLTPPNCFGSADGTVSVIAAGGIPAYQYLWNTIPSQNASTITGLSGGNYSVTVSDANNCTATQNMNITEPTLLTVSIDPTPFVEIFSGSSTTLTAINSSAVTSYQWSPAIGLNCGTCASTLASPATTTNYTVVVTNANNCTANATVQVIVTNPHVVFVPNVFSPNNDGNNDFFQIFGTLEQIAFMEMQIFNRWGEKVFESSDHHFNWDGTYQGERAPQGIYTYQLKLTYMNGERDELRKGSLTLLR